MLFYKLFPHEFNLKNLNFKKESRTMNHKKINRSPNTKANKALYQSHKVKYYSNGVEESSEDQRIQRISPHEYKVSTNKLSGKPSYVVCVGKKYPELITIDSPPNANTGKEAIERLLLEQERLIERYKKIMERISKN